MPGVVRINHDYRIVPLDVCWLLAPTGAIGLGHFPPLFFTISMYFAVAVHPLELINLPLLPIAMPCLIFRPVAAKHIALEQ